MKPEQQKTAEFVIEYLPDNIWLRDNQEEYVIQTGLPPILVPKDEIVDFIFNGPYSPNILDLGQEKAEREGLVWTMSYLDQSSHSASVGRDGKVYSLIKDTNKFYAFWRALELAVGGGK